MGLAAGLVGSFIIVSSQVMGRRLGRRAMFSSTHVRHPAHARSSAPSPCAHNAHIFFSCVAAEPWEHVLGAGFGFYLGNAVKRVEYFYEDLAHKMVRAKMDANAGVLDEKYRMILGGKFDKYFPDKA